MKDELKWRRKTKNEEKITKCEDCRLRENLGEKESKRVQFQKKSHAASRYTSISTYKHL